MKTTLEIPDQLFRHTKASAALENKSLKDFVAGALREKLARKRTIQKIARTGWRSVFGRAPAAQVREVDKIIRAEFSLIDPE